MNLAEQYNYQEFINGHCWGLMNLIRAYKWEKVGTYSPSNPICQKMETYLQMGMDFQDSDSAIGLADLYQSLERNRPTEIFLLFEGTGI